MRRLRRHALLLALALALSAPAAAQPGDEVLLLDLCLNARCVGVAAVVVRGERVLIDREALLAAGLDPTALPAERIADRDFVDAAALGRGIVVTVDRAQLRVDLQQAASELPAQQVDLRTRATAEAAAQPWTAFVNYALTLGESRAEQQAFFDAAAGRGHAALRSTALWDEARGLRRGLTRFELDQPQHLRRWTVGDQFAVARDPLGGGALIGGVGVERAFDQDPYLVTFPQPFYQGVLETPGTVEIYANGALIGRRELGAGPFSLQNLGVPPGRSDLRIVVRDPFGGRSDLAGISYYGSSVLLTPGLTDYAVRLGPLRETAFDGGYGDAPALQAWARRGLRDWLTVGARVEGDRDLRNLGVDAALRSGLGEFGLAVSASDHDAAGRGHAASVSYSYGDRRLGLGLGARRFSAGYRNLGDPFAFFGGRLREDDFATLGWTPLSALTLQLGYGRQRRESAPVERNLSLGATWRLSGRAQLLGSVQRFSGARDDTLALLSFSYAFDRESLNLSARRDDGGRGYGLDVRRSRPPGIGWGYDASLQRFEDRDSGFGQVEYQGRYGRYALQADRFGNDTAARVIASGALIALGGRAYATPPLETGFALVRAPGLADVPVLRENLEVGRTDARGDLLVRDLIPFYPNQIALDAGAVPIDYEIRRGSARVAVPRNAGAVVAFDVRALQAVSGTLRIDAGDGLRTAEYGLLRLQREDGTTYQSPLGAQGRFYFEDLPPGRYAVEADSDGRRASCRIEVPAPAARGIVDLGTIDCAGAADAPPEP